MDIRLYPSSEVAHTVDSGKGRMEFAVELERVVGRIQGIVVRPKTRRKDLTDANV